MTRCALLVVGATEKAKRNCEDPSIESQPLDKQLILFSTSESTICSLIDGERVHTALETSVRLPIKLLAGEIRWLDDNHVIITEYNGDNTYLPFFDPDAAGNILLLEWKTGTITYVPPHVSSSPYFSSIGSAAKPEIL
ncbi:hypothetical protein NP233_g10255 [Leucocoprinus birnbaumii]|uniref:Uncharacterized protein n=1 Tax=Leucocoprinus birnbaumii TaxID=56174 RepID=A0AAD5YLH0_9AGAR|nr:hypothetical protein NP233_g10255 [Leucocoprinus birnbaumii]